MRTILDRVLFLVAKPFGPDDDGDDDTAQGAEGAEGESSRASGEQGQTGEGDDSPLTVGALKQILNERLTPIEQEQQRARNKRAAERRRAGKVGKGDEGGREGAGEGADGNRQKSTRELADEARERRLERLERLEQQREIRSAFDRELRKHEDALVKGAGAKIERMLASSVVIDDGEVFYREPTGDLIDLAEAIEREAQDPMFRLGAKRPATKPAKGDPKGGEGSNLPASYDVDFDSMSDEELEAWEKKEAERQRRAWERGQGR